ncbi:MAG TPA: hypothetical protein VFL94_12550, partial [Actinomycetales bacterium]|nr:hypothetical protein [Actinomycetales bacterium]
MTGATSVPEQVPSRGSRGRLAGQGATGDALDGRGLATTGSADHVRLHAVLVLVGASLFGTIGTARVLGPDSPSGSVGAVRVLLAAVVLMLLAQAARPAPGAWRRERRRVATLVAGLAQAAFQLTFLAAVLQTGVAVGTLVAIGSAPLVAGLLSRQVSRTWLVATSVALAGLVLLVLGGGGARLSWPGLLLALGAGASYGVYLV